MSRNWGSIRSSRRRTSPVESDTRLAQRHRGLRFASASPTGPPSSAGPSRKLLKAAQKSNGPDHIEGPKSARPHTGRPRAPARKHSPRRR
jgi:hypothetical protein